ncbi:histidine phosphatase family protein [Gordonia sp. DT30]|uniref:histidine phosphatase family protein n=1 Tax=unclassified Gordonia (in: high G+C Gram-positive bacteria) TaxID=2657482 RepID=UPI003CEA8241
MARLHLVRHGETTANVMRRLDTALPGAALTDFGVRQGVRYGLENRLQVTGESAGRPAVLVSSLARRAQQTAELIGSVWEVDPEAVEGIHEVQAGELEDRSDDEAHGVFREVLDAWYGGAPQTRIPGGESLQMVYDRYLPAIDELAKRHLSGPDATDVVVVSHGAAIRLVAARLAGIDGKFAAATHLPNAGSVELEYRDGLWVCHRWGAIRAPFGQAVDEPLVVDGNPMG